MEKVTFLSALALCCGSAFGADLPRRTPAPSPAAPFLSPQSAANWTGFYVGVLAGAGLGDVTNASLSPITNADLSPITGKLNRSGALAGLQAGYGFMRGSVHMGVEADMALTTLRGRQSASGAYGGAPASASLEAKTRTLGMLRGRVGYLADDFLIYATGGMASALQASTFTVTQNNLGPSLTTSGHSYGPNIGWVLGFGVERFVMRDISGKLEYLYVNMGDGIRGRSTPNGLHLLRGGVNYHF